MSAVAERARRASLRVVLASLAAALAAALGPLLPAESAAQDEAPAAAADPGPWRPDAAYFGGDIKQFFFMTFPYEHPLMPEDPSGQAIFDVRLKGSVKQGGWRAELHPVLTTIAPGALSTGGFVQTGVGVPEAVELSAELVDASGLFMRARVDRANLSFKTTHVAVTLGRQPVSFGRGAFFTPLDLVNPFQPTVIDSSYKPGVDAARVDLYAGESGQVILVAAYSGAWDRQGSVLAAWGQRTVGSWDLALFAASAHADLVGGLSANGGIGPIGLRAEGSVTRPDPEGAAPALDALRVQLSGEPLGAARDPYIRALIGADWRPGPRTTLSGEAYVQTLGAADPNDYFIQSSDPRYARGELWLAGRVYGALAVQQELRPTLHSGLSLIGNLLDPSALAGANLSWSVAGNAELLVGGYAGLGERPSQPPPLSPTLAAQLDQGQALGLLSEAEVTAAQGAWDLIHTPVNSEFGNTPAIVFTQLRTYF